MNNHLINIKGMQICRSFLSDCGVSRAECMIQYMQPADETPAVAGQWMRETLAGYASHAV